MKDGEGEVTLDEGKRKEEQRERRNRKEKMVLGRQG